MLYCNVCLTEQTEDLSSFSTPFVHEIIPPLCINNWTYHGKFILLVSFDLQESCCYTAWSEFLAIYWSYIKMHPPSPLHRAKIKITQIFFCHASFKFQRLESRHLVSVQSRNTGIVSSTSTVCLLETYTWLF